MKTIKILLSTLCCVAFLNTHAQSSQGNVAAKLTDQLVGQWQVTKINDGNKNTQVSSHTNAMQNIEFTREAKYIVRNNSTKADSGLFRINEPSKFLYLESVNQTYPSEWKVDLKNNVLILTKRDKEKTTPVRYVYTRQSNVQRQTSKENNATNEKQ